MTEECWIWWIVWQSVTRGWPGYFWGSQQKAEAGNFDYTAWRKLSNTGKTDGIWWGCVKAVTPKSSWPGSPQLPEGPWHGSLEDTEVQTQAQLWDLTAWLRKPSPPEDPSSQPALCPESVRAWLCLSLSVFFQWILDFLHLCFSRLLSLKIESISCLFIPWATVIRR